MGSKNPGVITPRNCDMTVRQAIQQLTTKILGLESTLSFAGLTLTDLTASRLVSSDASKVLTSVSDLTTWIAGVANETDVTDDGDGTVTIGIVNPLIVAKGGIGVATLTDHGLLLGSGTGAVTPLAAATNGQIPIGSTGVDPVLAEITGTANQIVSTAGVGTITLSTPQDIHTGASPTFVTNTLTGLTTSRLVASDGSKNLISSDLNSWITGTANQITVTDDSDGTVTLSTPQNIHTGASPTWVGTTWTGKLDGGSQAVPIDVTDTRKYGLEFHYSGNNYDVTNIRSRAQLVTTDTTATACGGLFQAANNDNVNAGVLMGFMAEAIGKSTTNAATISTMRGGLIGTEWGAKDTITSLKTLHIRGHSRNAAGDGSFGTGYGLYIENEAVGGNGQAYDAGIYFKGTNLSGGNSAFTYGIDFTGGTYSSEEIKLANNSVIGSDKVMFQPTTDSTTFFQILDADGGTPILNIDSTNERVGVGTAAPGKKLEILDTSEQVRLRYDGSNYIDVLASSLGRAFIYPSEGSGDTWWECGATYFKIRSNSSTYSFIKTENLNNVQGWQMGLVGHSTEYRFVDTTNDKYPFKIAANSPNDSLFISTTGVGINTSTPDSSFQVVGTTRLGADSHYVQIATTTGAMTFVGNARFWQGMWLDTSNFKEPAANTATLVNRGVGTAYRFTKDQEAEHVHVQVSIPGYWDVSGDLQMILLWDTPVTSDDCDWEIHYQFRAANEAMDSVTYDGVANSSGATSSSTTKGLVHSTITIPTASFTAGDKMVRFGIYRDGVTDSIDDYVYLHGIRLRGVRNKTGGTM